MRPTFAVLALVALLQTTNAAAAADVTFALPEPPMETQVCHGPSSASTVCRAVVNTAFGAALNVARIVDGAACNLGSCGFVLSNTLIFLYRNLP